MRPTNKQLRKIATRLRFYEWTDLELTELVRRIRGTKPTREYANSVRETVEKMVAVSGEKEKEFERLAAILNQIELEVGDKPIA